MSNNILLLEPWQITFDERVNIYNDAVKKRKKIALYYSDEPDRATFRYRCLNVMQATQNSDKWQAVYFLRSEISKVKELLHSSDVFVMGRHVKYDNIIKGIVEEVRTENKPVLFDLDDLVFDKKYLHLVLNTIGDLPITGYWLPYFMNANLIAKQVDGYIVTNDFLGKKISQNFNKPYRVIRNSLSDNQVEASNAYIRLNKKNKRDKFVIGYFGGTPSHTNDLDVALPEILAFLQDYPDAKMRVVGFMEFDVNTRKFLETGQIEFLPLVDFRKLQRLISEVDVNIAPLVMNDFTNCKSELKFFEAGVAETTTIASPTYTFSKAITDGLNGFLAQPGEWYDKLEFLYKKPKENVKIAKEARKYALKHYHGKEFLLEIEKTYDDFLKLNKQNNWH